MKMNFHEFADMLKNAKWLAEEAEDENMDWITVMLAAVVMARANEKWTSAAIQAKAQELSAALSYWEMGNWN